MASSDTHHTHPSPQRQNPGKQHCARKRADILEHLYTHGSQHPSLCDDQQRRTDMVCSHPACNNQPGYQHGCSGYRSSRSTNRI
eukprot:2721318-Pyramimonas_sp.AAC.1